MSLLTLDRFPGPLAAGEAAMLISGGHPPPPPLLLPESSGEDPEVKAPKKRAETWVQDETLSLIAFRRELDALFNTSKSNRHLWETISAKMRDKGFDRSPTMCTDKWRNLLKEFKKARSHAKRACGNGGSAKMAYYKEIDELIKRRGKGDPPGGGKSTATSKIDSSYMHFATDKDFEDANIPFGPVEASGRSMLSVEGRLEHDRHPLAITAADAGATNGVNPWNWRDTSTNAADNRGPFGGRVILVKWGDYTRRIGIDGTAEAIKEAIRSAFGLRTKRAFWLEDEDEVVRSFDRDMPLGTYTLHLDDGVTIKVCTYEDTDRMSVRTEEKTFYTEEDFRDFLSRRSWILREFNGYRIVDTLDDLRPGAIYQGMPSMGE